MKMRIKEYTYNNKYKSVIKGLFFIVVIILFAFSVLKMYEDETSPILNKLEEQNSITTKKLDSLKLDNKLLKKDIDSLQESDSIHKRVIHNLYEQNNLNYNILKNLKNEKDFINPVTYNEQIEFISKYRYTPYE